MGKRTLPKQQRLNKAKQWLPTYNGEKIVKGYRKKFAVDTLTAIRDLKDLGVQLDPAYVTAVENSEKQRLLRLQQQKQEKLMEQHEMEMMYDEFGIWNEFYDDEAYETINILDNHRINFENDIGTIKKAGKNHVKVNGTLLQTNKKWSQLKQKQRTWIYEITRQEHHKFVEKNDRLPLKSGKNELVAVIESKVDERGIWLPSHELEKGIGRYIDKLNRKTQKDNP